MYFVPMRGRTRSEATTRPLGAAARRNALNYPLKDEKLRFSAVGDGQSPLAERSEGVRGYRVSTMRK